jgi:glycosyltransferase involved in cell wall biosynthesis
MRMDEPLVTIVIPVYNQERYVAATMVSVTEQTYRNLEIIVINDGATDKSIDICRSFKDERIRILSQPNAGLASARNLGLYEARGDLVGFIDADDLWLPEKVERHVKQFLEDSCLGVAYSYSEIIDEKVTDWASIRRKVRTRHRFRIVSSVMSSETARMC